MIGLSSIVPVVSSYTPIVGMTMYYKLIAPPLRLVASIRMANSKPERAKERNRSLEFKPWRSKIQKNKKHLSQSEGRYKCPLINIAV
jgi:hypothetical protein